MRLLAIYLQDHLAASTAMLELAKRAQSSNTTNDFGRALATLRDEIAADREVLLDVMRGFGVGRDRLKEGAVWGAEKAGRLKLNGRLRGYSPLSRVLELEGLAMGIAGKRRLWEALERLPDDQRPSGVDLGALAARAEAQQTQVAELHARATAIALA